MSDYRPPFIRRVILRNYKSIQGCDVNLGPFMLLVGPNGSGKSNFLDALRFVTDSLRNNIDQALRERGGVKEVRRRSRGYPNHFSIQLEINLPDNAVAYYRFRVGACQEGRFEIQEEACSITGKNNGGPIGYQVVNGKVKRSDFPHPPPASTDRLYLTNAAGFPEFRGLYDSLMGMGFYNINPDRLRDLQEPDAGNLLLRDGRNLTSVLDWIERNNKQVKERIEEYMGSIVSGIKHVDIRSLGPKETLEFRQTVAGDENPWCFFSQNMSDGTLRALGVLVSLFQCFDRKSESPIPLVGIEEPEATLHPAATAALMGALHEASVFTQVLATSYSPDLLDALDLSPDMLLVVDAQEGETKIGPADDAGKSILRDRLYSAGELLKQNMLKPQPQPKLIEPAEISEEDFPLFQTRHDLKFL